ncbi:hypothetical protein ACFDAU_14805 [Sulfuriferula sp. GW1]|uniref:hypothetical protein n=1 Tax=Sulfuriferula sp. GW1 TaxID=3345111 RepID=UPI0039AF1FE8
MSITKRFMEFQEEQDSIRVSLQALIDDERITNPVSVGIAKKLLQMATSTHSLRSRRKPSLASSLLK